MKTEVPFSRERGYRVLNRFEKDFLSNVSHELRTPITAAHGYLAVLEDGLLGGINNDQREALRIALRNIERLNRLVGDLLDFSSISNGQFCILGEPVDLAAVFKASLARVADFALEKRVVLESQFSAQLGSVCGSGEKLTQAFGHLLENAVKFSEEGQQVLLTACRRERHYLIEVIDQGVGMTPEQLQRAFTPFVQGDSGLARRYGGLGVGLPLIQHLITLHGGEITLRSTSGQGTIVLISLPVFERDSSAVEE